METTDDNLNSYIPCFLFSIVHVPLHMAIDGVVASDEGMNGAGDEGGRDGSSGGTNVSGLRAVLSSLLLRGRVCRVYT